MVVTFLARAEAIYFCGCGLAKLMEVAPLGAHFFVWPGCLFPLKPDQLEDGRRSFAVASARPRGWARRFSAKEEGRGEKRLPSFGNNHFFSLSFARGHFLGLRLAREQQIDLVFQCNLHLTNQCVYSTLIIRSFCMHELWTELCPCGGRGLEIDKQSRFPFRRRRHHLPELRL